jgi:hypothetical protein
MMMAEFVKIVLKLFKMDLTLFLERKDLWVIFVD